LRFFMLPVLARAAARGDGAPSLMFPPDEI
jgi:hypothetical protein